MTNAVITKAGSSLTVTLDGELLLSHSPEEPFAFAVIGRTGYTSFHGNIRETDSVDALVPMTDLSFSDGGFELRGGEYSLRLLFESDEDGITLRFLSGSDCYWLFRLPPEEAVYGGGERYRSLDLKGQKIPNLVTEHIILKTLVQKTLLPKSAYKEKDNSFIGTYVPMPLFITGSKKLILWETPYGGSSEFGNEYSSFEFAALPQRLRILKKPGFEDLSRCIAEIYPNRQYIPGWCDDGFILGVQGGRTRVAEICQKMLSNGVPLSAVWCQDWCGENITVMGKQVRWNFAADEALYPDLAGFTAELREKGIRFLAYLNPYLLKDCELYNYCREKGWLITHTDGSIYHIKSTTFDAGMLDLTNPDVCVFVKETLIKKNMLSLGVSGWMSDFGEYLPMDCVLHSGDPEELHNQWPLMWARLNREAVDEWGDRDVFFFSRSGYPGIQTYAPVLWSGDQHTDLTRDYGMPSVIPASLSLGISGVTLCHSDIGGFFSFVKIKRSRETLLRWMEMNCLSPMMRSHESLRPTKCAQPYDDDVIALTAKLTRLHVSLKEYIRAVITEAQSGIPAMRAPVYMGENIPDEYCYFLGNDLYVCPVTKAHARERAVTLPAGSWTQLLTGTEYTGGGSVTVPAPLGMPVAFYRQGSPYEAVFREAGRLWNENDENLS